MAQMTWRASEERMQRVRRAAEQSGRSMNEYVTAVLDVATDPSLASTEAERLRDRLAAAGLLIAPGPTRQRPPASRVARARKAAGRGTLLSELVAGDR